MNDLEFIPALQKYGGPDNFWFQQDGATPHCTDMTLELLRVYFGERIIRRADIEWPASSPDLNPLDFYLWGHLDAQVKKARPKTLNQIKEILKIEIEKISSETLKRLFKILLDE
uniref:Tc1-like transposase DDE domain-containing protein n=1 Tax=Tetranychus urticae TaxID=32264 RepID=A0A158P5N6_TETUR